MANQVVQKSVLPFAVEWRSRIGAFQGTDALRIFYGPGESTEPFWKSLAIDLFQTHVWVTLWEQVPPEFLNSLIDAIRHLELPTRPVESIVVMDRSKVASEKNAELVWGEGPVGRFEINEYGAKYWIQFQNTKHPGLFLDHAPLRQWLLNSQSGKTVLNLFAYTGSLSVAASLGGADHVTTIDLSKQTVEWAKENWDLNPLAEEEGDFIYGDVFEWLPKLAKRGAQFDTILSDPPSFSRSKNGTFSTQKDLAELHELIFPLLKVGGVLVTSINSENISEAAYLRDIEAAADKTKTRFRILKRIDLPETFPTLDPSMKDRYLKGFYLLRV